MLHEPHAAQSGGPTSGDEGWGEVELTHPAVRPPAVLTEPDLEHLAATLAGISVGTLAVIAFGLWGVGWAAALLFIATAVLSAAYRRFTGLLAVLLALFCWYASIAPHLAPPVPGDYDLSFFMNDNPPRAIFVFGCLVATIAYPIGLPFRIGPNRTRLRRPAAVAAFVSFSALAFSVIVAPPASAASSYSITFPPGWSAYPAADTSGIRPEYCAVDATGLSATLVAQDLTIETSPTFPWICVTVVQGGPVRQSDAYGLGDYMGRLQGWSFQEPPNAPPIAGSHEMMAISATGDRFYGFAVARSRGVGPVSEQIRYTIVALVPAGSRMTDVDIYDIVSTFQFR